MADSIEEISSRAGDWPEYQTEGLEVHKILYMDTVLEVCNLMKGIRGRMPNRDLHQPPFWKDDTAQLSTLDPNSVGKTESEVFEYFGYIQINGKWVDPDSEKAIYCALKGHPTLANPVLPGLDFSSGPYILSESEQSIVYAEFVDDEDDSGEDPRTFQITPETFARWAQGAVKRQEPQHEVLEENIQVRSGPRQRFKERAKLTIMTPQYCAQTGERMSPAYSIDESPIPMLSPQDVNMNSLPLMFSYSYPLDALDLKRNHYFDSRVANRMPAPSGPEHITSECLRDALAVDGDLESGIRQFDEIKDYIYQLQRDCQAKLAELNTAIKFRTKLDTELEELRTNTCLLRNRVADMVEHAKQPVEHRRIKEHVGGYIEMLTHRRERLALNVQKLRGQNGLLCKERDRYTAEQLDLQHTAAALGKMMISIPEWGFADVEKV